jgi:hypothetical protein
MPHLNTLLLRQRTAEARGFGADVKLPVLAKLMLAERFLPRLFDQIAAASAADPNGYCDELASLEAAREDGKTTPPPASGEAVEGKKEIARAEGATDSGESPLLAEWLSSQSIRAWAQVGVGDDARWRGLPPVAVASGAAIGPAMRASPRVRVMTVTMWRTAREGCRCDRRAT